MTKRISSDDSYEEFSLEDEKWLKETESQNWIGMALRILFALAVWVVGRYGLVFLAGGRPETGVWPVDIFCYGLYWMWPLFAYIILKASAHLHEASNQEKRLITGLLIFFCWPILMNLLSLFLGWVDLGSLSESIFSFRWISQVWILVAVLIFMLGKLLILVIKGERSLV